VSLARADFTAQSRVQRRRRETDLVIPTGAANESTMDSAFLPRSAPTTEFSSTVTRAIIWASKPAGHSSICRNPECGQPSWMKLSNGKARL